MAITKAELSVSLHEELGLNKRESKEFVEQFFETIKNALEDGSSVKLSGFETQKLVKKFQFQHAG